MFDPNKDGVDHINIYSKGVTKLGRHLSNFANIKLVHPIYGRFESMEGYWYFVKTGKIHDQLKSLYGFTAKQVGREFDIVENEDFENEIILGTRLKLYQNPKLLRATIKNELPLTHYYNYRSKTIFPKGMDFPKIIENIIKDFK